MAQLKIIVTDDFGNEIGYHEYPAGEGVNLAQIERKVEELRPQILSDITKDLLVYEQAEYKKTSYPSKGSYPLKIKTINGSFEFRVTKYETPSGSSNWLRLTHEGLSCHQESELLQEFALRWTTRLSYEKVSQLVAERSGTSSLSDQRIYQMVEEKASELVGEQREKIKENEV